MGPRAAAVVVALSLALLAVHHAAPHAAHDGAIAPMSHGSHTGAGLEEPASVADDVAAVCIAVLPLLLAGTLGIALATARGRFWGLLHEPALASTVGRGYLLRGPPRAGPQVLCVMRC